MKATLSLLTILILMCFAQVIGAGVMMVIGGWASNSPEIRESVLFWVVTGMAALAGGLFFLVGAMPAALKLLTKIKG